MRKIDLAFECPVKYLDTFASNMDYEFALTHLLSNPDYKAFFKKQISKGRRCILDNSAFELDGPVSNEVLVEATLDLMPKVVVAPDHFKDSAKTLEKTESFISLMARNGILRRVDIAGVVQGSTFDEWIACYQKMSSMEWVTWICIAFEINFELPNEEEIKTSSLTRARMLKRIHLVRWLEKMGLLCNKDHHLLGMSDGFELFYQSEIPQITSADTSSPIIHGLNNIHYTIAGLPGEKIKEKMNFDLDNIGIEQLFVIYKNIDCMKEWAKGKLC